MNIASNGCLCKSGTTHVTTHLCGVARKPSTELKLYRQYKRSFLRISTLDWVGFIYRVVSISICSTLNLYLVQGRQQTTSRRDLTRPGIPGAT